MPEVVPDRIGLTVTLDALSHCARPGYTPDLVNQDIRGGSGHMEVEKLHM